MLCVTRESSLIDELSDTAKAAFELPSTDRLGAVGTQIAQQS